MALLSVSTDADIMLLALSQGLGHPSLHRRLGALDALGAWFGPTEYVCEAVSKPQARALVRLLLTALCNPQYLERLWIVGLGEVIAAASRSERCPMFTPTCVINLAGEPSNTERSCIHDTAHYCSNVLRTESLDRCTVHLP